MAPDGDRRGPRHLAFHLLTVLAVLVCLVAARWQWERAHRTEAEAIPDTPVVALADLDPTSAYAGMRVRLEGTFDAAREVLVAPRQRGGQPGAWVLTPLQPSTPVGEAAVAVVRGWVPEGARPAEPPDGPVSVVAVLVADSRQPGAAPVGDPPTMPVVDTGALAAHAGYPVRSGWFALQALTPPASGQPQPLQVTELPGADVGLNWRNASYALQWIAFAGFVLFFWVRFRRDLVRSEQESPR
jgi:cytochrome oxidase assembly protein ShyY1